MVIGTKGVFGQVDYYATIKMTPAIPAYVDENSLSNADKMALEEWMAEGEECDENVKPYVEHFSFLLSMSKELLKSMLEGIFGDEEVTISERDGFVIATYEDEDDGTKMEMAINLDELIYEERYFGGEDNPFFDEIGNKLWGLYRVIFMKKDGFIIPISETDIFYDELPSEIFCEVTNVFTYLYYKKTNDYGITVKTGDEELYNDCIGHTSIKEIQQTADIKIYPNPANERVTVNLPSYMNEDVDIKIFNTLGLTVLSQRFSGDKVDIDIHSLPAGIYVVRCVKNDKIITKRFVKQ